MCNGKKWIKSVSFLMLAGIICVAAEFSLVSPSYTRLDIHNMQEKKYDDVFFGTSHGLAGISPAAVDSVTGRKSMNFCLPSAFLIDNYYLLKELNRYQKPKRLIYELDPGYWVVPEGCGKNEVFIYQELPMSPNKLEYGYQKYKKSDFRTALFPWYYSRSDINNIDANVKLKTSREYRTYSPDGLAGDSHYYNEDGFLFNRKLPGADKGGLNIVLWDRNKVQSERVEYFRKIVQYCREEKIELAAVVLPVPQDTLDQYPEVYRDADKYFTKLMKEYDISYRNFNYVEDSRIDKSMDNYYDYDGHMYGEAAERFSVALGEYLEIK